MESIHFRKVFYVFEVLDTLGLISRSMMGKIDETFCKLDRKIKPKVSRASNIENLVNRYGFHRFSMKMLIAL